MYVVVVKNWEAISADSAQALAGALGVTVFEVRQRLVGGGPVIVACFAEHPLAESLRTKIDQIGFVCFIVDVDQIAGSNSTVVHRFAFGSEGLEVEAVSGDADVLPYHEIKLLLPAASISEQTEAKTVTARKFSMGKTLLAGGLPMTKKVKSQELVATEVRQRVLYLCAGSHGRLLCPQNSMVYTGLGSEMKASRELNFSFLMTELRRLCPAAIYDERILTRASQARILGPLLAPESHLELAVAILEKSLIT